MTARELPVLFVTMLVLGAGFTFAINSMLGGTVQTAAPRVAPADDSTPSSVAIPSDEVTTTAGYPSEAGNPRIWRTSSTTKRDSNRGAASRRKKRKSTPAAKAPTKSTPPTSPPATFAPSPSPAPATPQPAPKPKSTPRSNGGGGGSDFYNSG